MDEVRPVDERFVVVHAHQVGRGRGSGVSVGQDVVYLYEISDERCVYVNHTHRQHHTQRGLEASVWR